MINKLTFAAVIATASAGASRKASTNTLAQKKVSLNDIATNLLPDVSEEVQEAIAKVAKRTRQQKKVQSQSGSALAQTSEDGLAQKKTRKGQGQDQDGQGVNQRSNGRQERTQRNGRQGRPQRNNGEETELAGEEIELAQKQKGQRGPQKNNGRQGRTQRNGQEATQQEAAHTTGLAQTKNDELESTTNIEDQNQGAAKIKSEARQILRSLKAMKKVGIRVTDYIETYEELCELEQIVCIALEGVDCPNMTEKMLDSVYESNPDLGPEIYGRFFSALGMTKEQCEEKDCLNPCYQSAACLQCFEGGIQFNERVSACDMCVL